MSTPLFFYCIAIIKERNSLTIRRTDNSSEWNEGVTPRNAPPDTPIGVNNDVMVKSSVKSAESNPNR